MNTDERIDDICDAHQGVNLAVSVNDVIWLVEQLQTARKSLKTMKGWWSSPSAGVALCYVNEEAQRGLGERK